MSARDNSCAGLDFDCAIMIHALPFFQLTVLLTIVQAMEALETFQLQAIHQLSKHSSGYLVELAAGLCLAAFGSPLQAVQFGLQLVQSLKMAEWNEDLLVRGY